MSSKLSILFLVIAIILGLATSAGTRSYLLDQTKGYHVLVANRDISAGLAIDEGNFESLFRRILVPDTFKDMRSWVLTPEQKALIVGRAPSVDIPKNDLITLSQFDPLNVQREIFSKLEEGDRAVSLSIELENSVANVIRPGDYVDIIGIFQGRPRPFEEMAEDGDEVTAETPETFDREDTSALKKYDLKAQGSSEVPQDGTGTSQTVQTVSYGVHARTILQRVYVLGVGQRFSDFRYSLSGSRNFAYGNVTLKLSQEETQKLILAQQLGGEMTLTLRHPDDEGIVDLSVTEVSSIF